MLECAEIFDEYRGRRRDERDVHRVSNRSRLSITSASVEESIVCSSYARTRHSVYRRIYMRGHGDVHALYYIHIDVLACTITLLTLKTGSDLSPS